MLAVMDSITEAFGVPSGLWGLGETTHLVISELQGIYWGDLRKCHLESRELWSQEILYSNVDLVNP